MAAPRTVRLDTYTQHLVETAENASKVLRCLEIMDKDTYNRVVADGSCYFNGILLKVLPDGRIAS